VVERAQAVRGAASLLEKANQARLQGNRSLADQLFTSAEIIVGTPAVADLIPLFREGAPPRVTTALRTVAKDAAPQPAAVGSSEEDGDKKLAASKAASLSGTVMLPGERPLPGIAVITLEPASGKFPHRTPKQRVIEQRNREFAPKVLAVPVGSTVSFPNFDNIYHNVFSRSRARSFDLGMYKAGQARELTFDKEGLIRIGCNLHANMSAYIVSVAAPHYVISEPGGKFSFRSLRPGRYRLRAWVENNDAPTVQDIEIKRDANTVAVTLSTDGGARPQTDKFGVPHGDTSHK
jgi:plastocyanin